MLRAAKQHERLGAMPIPTELIPLNSIQLAGSAELIPCSRARGLGATHSGLSASTIRMIRHSFPARTRPLGECHTP